MAIGNRQLQRQNYKQYSDLLFHKRLYLFHKLPKNILEQNILPCKKSMSSGLKDILFSKGESTLY